MAVSLSLNPHDVFMTSFYSLHKHTNSLIVSKPLYISAPPPTPGRITPTHDPQRCLFPGVCVRRGEQQAVYLASSHTKPTARPFLSHVKCLKHYIVLLMCLAVDA